MIHRQKRLLWGSVASSAVAHAAAFAVLPAAPPPERVPPSTFEFTMAPEPAPEPEPEPVAEPEPEPEAVEPPRAETPPEPDPTAPEPEAPPPETPDIAPAAEPPPELSGSTMVNPYADGFALPVGNGLARTGSIRAGTGVRRVQKTVAKPSAPSPPRPKAPSTVPLRDLSKRPEPPALAGALQRNYPQSARQQGLSGQAKVRARVDADGKIRVTKVAGQSSAVFGKACERTLQGTRWSVPRDAKGNPVATWITYRCQFRVDD